MGIEANLEWTLDGRTALVTGGTRRGIGAATAILLAARGANVIVNYGTSGNAVEAEGRVRRFIDLLKGVTPKVAVVHGSVATEESAIAIIEDARSHFGAIDILVNNAGGPYLPEDFADLDRSRLEGVSRTELEGTLYLIRETLPAMRHQRWGRIINIGIDSDAMRTVIDRQNQSMWAKCPYSYLIAKTAKHAIAELLYGSELGYGITVNNILPGIIEECDNESVIMYLKTGQRVPLLFDPIDVANAILLLCSPMGRAITGASIRIPGNMYSRL